MLQHQNTSAMILQSLSSEETGAAIIVMNIPWQWVPKLGCKIVFVCFCFCDSVEYLKLFTASAQQAAAGPRFAVLEKGIGRSWSSKQVRGPGCCCCASLQLGCPLTCCSFWMCRGFLSLSSVVLMVSAWTPSCLCVLAELRSGLNKMYGVCYKDDSFELGCCSNSTIWLHL